MITPAQALNAILPSQYAEPITPSDTKNYYTIQKLYMHIAGVIELEFERLDGTPYTMTMNVQEGQEIIASPRKIKTGTTVAQITAFFYNNSNKNI